MQDPVNLADPNGFVPITKNSNEIVLYKPEFEDKVIKELEPRHTEDVDGIYFTGKRQCIKIPGNCYPGYSGENGELHVSRIWKQFMPFDPLHPFGPWFPGRIKTVGPDFFSQHKNWPNLYTAKNGWEGREKW